MKHEIFRIWLFGVAVSISACGLPFGGSDSENDEATPIDLEIDGLVPDEDDLQNFQSTLSTDPNQIELGKLLFFDKELSGNRDVSCSTCHHPTEGTGDGLPLSVGTGGTGIGSARELGTGRSFIPRNAPAVFNIGLTDWTTMFWDSRVSGSEAIGFTSPAAGDLPDGLDHVLAVQAIFPLTSREEMRGDNGDLDVNGNLNELAQINDTDITGIWNGVVNRLKAIPEYVSLFQNAFPGLSQNDISIVHVGNAIASFESSAFTTFDTPWDDYLAGDLDAISEEQKEGAVLFFGRANCSRCHSGPFFSDQDHHNIGVPQLGPGKGDSAPLDTGLALETGQAADDFKFRTPPLRNIELTGPYMHNGAYATLEAAVRHYRNPRNAIENYDESQLPTELRSTVQDSNAVINSVRSTLDPIVDERIELDNEDIDRLVAFLRALTSPTAQNLTSVTPASVPSGLSVE